MKWPWGKRGKDNVLLSKKAEKAAAQLRDENNKFSSGRISSAVSKSADDENRTMTTTINTMDSMIGFMTKFDELVDRKVEQRLEYENDGATDNEWLPIVKEILPYLPNIMQKIGITSVGEPNGGASPPPQASPPQASHDVMKYMALAAKAHKIPGGIDTLKAVLPQAYEEMEKAGIDSSVFKQAVININRAIE